MCFVSWKKVVTIWKDNEQRLTCVSTRLPKYKPWTLDIRLLMTRISFVKPQMKTGMGEVMSMGGSKWWSRCNRIHIKSRGSYLFCWRSTMIYFCITHLTKRCINFIKLYLLNVFRFICARKNKYTATFLN